MPTYLPTYFNALCFAAPQLRETHESEQEKAYQLKAQVIEVRDNYFVTYGNTLEINFTSFFGWWEGRGWRREGGRGWKEVQLCSYVNELSSLQDGEAGLFHHPEFPRQGYLMVQDKNRPG